MDEGPLVGRHRNGGVGEKGTAVRTSISELYAAARSARLEGRLQQAIDQYREVLRHDPAHARAHNGLAHALRHAGRLADALPHAQRAVELDPRRTDPWNNLGNCHLEAGRIRDALRCFRTAVEIDPACVSARWNRGLVLLALGDYREGWRDYESGYRLGTRAQRPLPREALPQGSMRGRSVLAWAEQGVGEEILFASCIPDLVGTGARVILECDPRLAPVFARSFAGVHVIGRDRGQDMDWLATLDPVDFHVPVGALPEYFRRDSSGFPAGSGHLFPEPKVVQTWRDRLHDSGDGFVVGISWRGGRDARARERRSIPLEKWLPVLTVAGMTFVNLQHGPAAGEADAVTFPRSAAGTRWPQPDPLVDLDGFAALMSALDLVITVDNATANLAGALGVPTWVMLPLYADWRWLHEGDRTPWYPCCRLFRQQAAGEWDPVLATVASALQEYVRCARPAGGSATGSFPGGPRPETG